MDENTVNKDRHRYGDSLNARAKFIQRSIRLSSQFPDKHFHRQLLLTYKDIFVNDGKLDRTSDITEDRESMQNDKLESLVTAVCSQCGSKDRKAIKVVSKPKTGKSILRAINKRKTNKSQANFQTQMLETYFNRPNTISYQCKFCHHKVKHAGEKRSSDGFLRVHNLKRKLRKAKRKQSAKESEQSSACISADLSASTSGLGTSLEGDIFQGATSSPHVSNIKRLSVSSLNSSASYHQKNTSSPMQSYRSDSHSSPGNLNSIKPKAAIARVTNTNSAAILRKFKQHHVDQIIKTDKKMQEKIKTKGSALGNFLNAMK